ncbi:hypothetical protein D5086_029437 [Populus alba]|uniref:Uncharacterized protein n=1 Tax=Populus alba TaxID=43335 RepID=A0ACC4ATI3_POPAL
MHLIKGKQPLETPRKILCAIQQSDQKIWLFETLLLSGPTTNSLHQFSIVDFLMGKQLLETPASVNTSSPSCDSTSPQGKTASGNSCKNLASCDSAHPYGKKPFRNSCKNLGTIQRLDQKIWLFETLLLSGPTTNTLHRVAILHLLKGKHSSKIPVNFCAQSNDQIKRYGSFEKYSCIDLNQHLFNELQFCISPRENSL